jgi:bacillithiol biosynthesis deacetylase BshB1
VSPAAAQAPDATRAPEGPEAPLDVLAIAAHPDDAELTCGGTLGRCAEGGYRVGVLDLARGEMATRGSPEIRAQEAACASEVLGLAVRENAGLPDAHLYNTDENRRVLVSAIRRLRPRVVILPFARGRHPDHRIASELGRDACFLAGLAAYGGGTSDGTPAHRPYKILYALSYREDPVKPTFVVPLSEEQFRRKMEAIRCFASQFEGANTAGEIFPTGQPLFELVETQSRHYGSLVREAYGEPFYTDETVAVEDVVRLSVQSM